ncbi:conserved domain protein [Paenibacillus sp. HGF5]|nr:conserved domain protein [Paenibacillus sp. HGF5]
MPSDFNLINIVKEIGRQQRSETRSVSAASLLSNAIIYEAWINKYKRLKSYDQEKYA